MLQLLVALQLAAAVPRASPRDSTDVVTRLRGESARFLRTWRTNWETSEESRHTLGPRFAADRWSRAIPGTERVMQDRLDHLHCHPDFGDAVSTVQMMLYRFNRLGKPGASSIPIFGF